MKPVKLTLQGFKSYIARTTLDFTLPSQNIFLISGETGSGKSTIFDAIVFALFGEMSTGRLSSTEKSYLKVQNNITACSSEAFVSPFVELTFTEQKGTEAETYTVYRVPRHTRPAKRGSGFTEEKESVSLTLSDGMSYTGNLSDTDRKISEIVGLTKEQFMQVCMIAQGEFKDALKASTKEKKEIYRKLFHTEIYDSIAEKTGELASGLRSDIDSIQRAFRANASGVSLPESSAIPNDFIALKENMEKKKEISVTDMESFLSFLQNLCDQTEIKISAVAADTETKKEETDKAQEALSEGKACQSLFEQLDKASNQLSILAAREKEIKDNKALADNIDTALALSSSFKNYSSAQSRENAAQTNMNAAKLLTQSLKEEKERSANAASVATEAYSAAGKELSEIKTQVDSALNNFRKMGELKEQSDKAKATINETEQKKTECESKLKTLSKQKEACQAKLTELENSPVRLEQVKANLEKVRNLLETFAKLRDEHLAVNKGFEELKVREELFADMQEQYRYACRDLASYKSAFYGAQAGIIARDMLREGEACPVCGSLSHPHPCALAEDHKELTKEFLDKKETEVNTLENSVNTTSLDISAQRGLLNERSTTLETRRSNLLDDLHLFLPGTSFPKDEEGCIGKLRDICSSFAEDEKKLQSDLVTISECKKWQGTALEEEKTLQQNIESYKNAIHSASAEQGATLSAYSALKESTPFENEEIAQDMLAAAIEKNDEASKEYRISKEKESASASAYDANISEISIYESQLPSLRNETSEAKASYEALLSEKKMASETWKKLYTMYTKEDVNRFREQAEEFGKEFSAAKSSVSTLQEQLRGKSTPDIDALEDAYKIANDGYISSVELLKSLSSSNANNKRVLSVLSENMDGRTQLVKRYNTLNSLYKRLSGTESKARIGLETFVQRHYLENVVTAANERFFDLTGGQYTIRLIDIRDAAEKGSSEHGLDIMAYSTITDSVNEIGSLSGGESFVAALSMALGLADQIKAGTSCANLDMMFIDEGFGSLDDTSRHEAVRVLKEMAGGNKLIGIISHINELKTEIDDVLQVTKDDKGSHFVWS